MEPRKAMLRNDGTTRIHWREATLRKKAKTKIRSEAISKRSTQRYQAYCSGPIRYARNLSSNKVDAARTIARITKMRAVIFNLLLFGICSILSTPIKPQECNLFRRINTGNSRQPPVVAVRKHPRATCNNRQASREIWVASLLSAGFYSSNSVFWPKSSPSGPAYFTSNNQCCVFLGTTTCPHPVKGNSK